MGHRPTEARFFSRLEERIARIFHPGDPHPLAILHSLLFRLSNQSSTTGFQVWCIKEHDRMSSFRRRVKGVQKRPFHCHQSRFHTATEQQRPGIVHTVTCVASQLTRHTYWVMLLQKVSQNLQKFLWLFVVHHMSTVINNFDLTLFESSYPRRQDVIINRT